MSITDNLSFLNGNISIIKIIMILYLFVFANIISSKINKKIVDNINESFIVKHLVGIITIAVLLSLLYDNLNIIKLLFYSITIYFVFLLSTKVSTKYVAIPAIILLGIYFINYFNDNKLKDIKNDKSIDFEKKENMINIIQNKNIHMTLFYIVAVAIGAFFYDENKSIQFGGSYSLVKLLD